MALEKQKLLIAVKHHAARLHGREPESLSVTCTHFRPKVEAGSRIIHDKRVRRESCRILKREFDRLPGLHREVLRAIGIAIHDNGRALDTLLVQSNRTRVCPSRIPARDKHQSHDIPRLHEPIPPHILL